MKFPNSRPLKELHPWRTLGLLAVLGLAVHLILPQIASLQHSWQVLETMTFWVVGLAIIAQILSYMGSGYLIKSIFTITGQHISQLRSTLIFVASCSIGLIAGGMVGSATAIYRWTNNGDNQRLTASLSGVLPPMLNNFVLMLVSIFGLVHLLIVHELTKTQAIGFAVTLVILSIFIGGIFLTLRFREPATAVFLKIARFFSRISHKPFDPAPTMSSMQNLFDAWNSLRDGHWHKLLLGAFFYVAFDMLTLYLLFIAAGNPISIGALLAGYGLPLLLGKIAFVLPGGVGVVEGSMIALYTGLGVTNAVSGIVVLGYRLISFWLPILLGFPVAAYLGRRSMALRQ